MKSTVRPLTDFVEGETIHKMVLKYGAYLSLIAYEDLLQIAAIANLYRSFRRHTNEPQIETFKRALDCSALYCDRRLNKAEPALVALLFNLLKEIGNESKTNDFLIGIQNLIGFYSH